MEKFKVGDWVRNVAINRVFRYSYKDLEYDKANPSHSIHDKLWQPKEGEWCWYDHILVRVDKITNLDGKDKLLIYTLDIPMFSQTWSTSTNRLEPFIGTLPSFIKEQYETQ